jgi:hypothetical protein
MPIEQGGSVTLIEVAANQYEIIVNEQPVQIISVGTQGPPGIPGPTGEGVPPGGSTGQVLSKASDTDFDTEWTDGGTGSGTVTSVSVVTANGVSGTVANPTTTPAISLTLGDITPSSVAASGTVTGSNLSGTNTGDQTITLTGDVAGSGTGSLAASIGAGKVTNTMLAGSITAAKLVGTDIATLGTITTGTWHGTTIDISHGGTGQTTANNALNALLPSQTGESGKVLGTDGTDTSWVNQSSGTVTSVSVVTANGVSGSVANPTTTPAITLTLGDITPSSVVSPGDVTGNHIFGIVAGTIPTGGNPGEVLVKDSTTDFDTFWSTSLETIQPAAVSSGDGGNSLGYTIQSGDGGDTSDASGTAGAAGDIVIVAGNGGTDTDISGGNGGNAGDIILRMGGGGGGVDMNGTDGEIHFQDHTGANVYSFNTAGAFTVNSISTKFINVTDTASTLGIVIRAGASQGSSTFQLQNSSGNSIVRMDDANHLVQRILDAPLTTTMSTSEFAIWYTDTPGSTSLNVKAKDSAGSVVTYSISGTTSGVNTGDQLITLTGNVTGSGTSSFATTIAASAVTNAMLAGSIAASKLVGSDIATVGTVTAGTWNATTIAIAHGGTGQTAATQALTPGTTVAWNHANGWNATLTPVQNFTLSNPTNIVAGTGGMLSITQDGTGSRVITWGSAYKFAGGTKFVLSTAAGAIDEIAWFSPDGTNIHCNGLAAFS